MYDAFDPMCDSGHISGKKACIEPLDTAGWRDSAGDQKQAGRIGQQARIVECRPCAGQLLWRAFYLAAEAEPGFLAGFPDSGDGQRTRARRRGLRATLGEIGFELGRQRRGDRDLVVGLVDTATWKDVFAGHEHDIGVSFADQHFRDCSGAVDQHQGRGVARTLVGVVICFLADLHVAHAVLIF